MLRRLELIGFKSFADRTRFDFAPGITAVVGPNGSGKSNIVDAVRWLLGEQSAKSLRGGEMTDVIFNGSSTRKSLGMAEVTMAFDNAARLLGVDADEVQITRRVYRDGEGEYLINGRQARLKDIKEAFLGTGAGHGAYSVIEQGRVDALLSASTKDRRAIFEEAAGISRFKAKKVETLRKLERADADLIRVRDILLELEKQLRTLRLQAAKAQRYQEYTTRLRDLRVAVSLREYQELSAALADEEQILADIRTELADATATSAAREEELRKLDWDLNSTEDTLRHQEAKLGDARQQIAAHEAAAKGERGQAAGLEAEVLRLGRQRAALAARTRGLETDATRVGGEAEHVARLAIAERERAVATAAAVADAAARIADLSRQAQDDRDGQFELVGRVAKLRSDAETSHAQADRLRRELDRRRSDADHTRTRHDALGRFLADLSRSDAGLRQRLADSRQSLADHVAARDDLRRRADSLQADLESLRESRSALRGRADVLEGLERSLEGFGAGVRAIVERLRAGDPRLTPHVRGMVADLLAAPRDVAPLIDLALGDVTQRFVVRDNGVSLDAVLEMADLPGRVGFIPSLTALPPPRKRVPGGEGPTTPASELVRCDLPDLADLPRQLLGSVLLVADLETARRLAPDNPSARFVTRSGELIEPDGTVIVGPTQAGAGILSRKSELRDLHAQITALDARIEAAESQQAETRSRADGLEGAIRRCEADIAALTGEAGTLRDQIVEQRQVQKQLADTLVLLAQEVALLERELAGADAAWREARRQAEDVETEAEEVRVRLAATDAALAAAEACRDTRVRENTEAQVALSRVSEQLAGLRTKREELDAELRLRRVDAVNLSAAERSARARLLDATLAALRATAAAADAYADKESRERQVAELTARRDTTRATREHLRHELKHSRDAWADRRDLAHAHELAARDLTARRDAITQRVQDEYGISLEERGGRGGEREDGLVELTPAPVGEALPYPHPSPLEPAQEIDDLRQKIAKLGSVNLEALGELADVEKREADLRTQFDDLADSRRKLQEIIDQINTDSRRLFAEVLAAVRAHFQELFRKLFGGGMADIVLENEGDVLESGIEITARPPGKETQRISLLSGGERALTAVALLLAIFRSKPSPFCLLDEVDAAMDEANTQRLAGLLREFSDRSQFVVITHKKRTMAVADVLHGVTMQESGVSKLVAVRFEDWPEAEESPQKMAA